jgi:hypothetical protein
VPYDLWISNEERRSQRWSGLEGLYLKVFQRVGCFAFPNGSRFAVEPRGRAEEPF